MIINHVAIWAEDLENMRDFYETFFQARVEEIYINPQIHFRSYFLQFSCGASLEIMQMPNVQASLHEHKAKYFGYAHMAISIGSKAQVDELTACLEKAGFPVPG